MLRSKRIALCCVFAAATMSWGQHASSQTPPADDPARAEAKRKYTAGTRAFDEKRYKDAIDLFLEADSFVPSAALAYNTAVAYEEMGDAASALRWSREYLRRTPNADDRAEIQRTIDKLEARLREKGIQQLTVLSSPPGATLLVDDRPLGVTPWTGELRPGSHRIELRLRGYRQAASVFDLRPDRAAEVSLSLVAGEEAQVPSASLKVQTPSTPDNTSADALAICGVVALGAGVAGLGVALGLEVARAGAEDDVREAELQVDAADKLGTMQDLQLGARIAVGIGGALALAGGSMLIAGFVSREPESSPKVSLGCSDIGCAFALRGQF